MVLRIFAPALLAAAVISFALAIACQPPSRTACAEWHVSRAGEAVVHRCVEWR